MTKCHPEGINVDQGEAAVNIDSRGVTFGHDNLHTGQHLLSRINNCYLSLISCRLKSEQLN